MQRSLYAYNLNSEIHLNNSENKDEAYHNNKQKFETSLLSTTKDFLNAEQYERFLKEMNISPNQAKSLQKK